MQHQFLLSGADNSVIYETELLNIDLEINIFCVMKGDQEIKGFVLTIML